MVYWTYFRHFIKTRNSSSWSAYAFDATSRAKSAWSLWSCSGRMGKNGHATSKIRNENCSFSCPENRIGEIELLDEMAAQSIDYIVLRKPNMDSDSLIAFTEQLSNRTLAKLIVSDINIFLNLR